MQAKNPLAKNSAKTPLEIVDVWNPCVQTTPEGKIVRGMAGRVHFFDNPQKKKTVKVDGNLTVYVFDGNETDPAHTKPLKLFKFAAETLSEHYSKQKPLGHGYNFFLPMDEVGGDEKSLCILVRFDNTLDEMLDPKVSRPVHAILPGRKQQTPTDPTIREYLESRSIHAENNRNMMAQFDSPAVQQVGYVEEKKDAASEKSKTSTIPLDGNMTRRLRESGTISVGEDSRAAVQ
jgi:hypothetical protein